MNREELLNRLIEADEEIYATFGHINKIDVVIVGGSSLLIRGLLSRQTQDIKRTMVNNEKTAVC